MARTAPVPNIPPIPGMCPGTIVKGGGAGGSGDGSGDGADGDGKNGANGKDGEKDPNGDGKGGKCGAGGPAGCTGCSAKPGAGDPVDIITGDVTTGAIDFKLPGPIELKFERTYASGDTSEDRGLGFGWSFTFGWTCVVHDRVVLIGDAAGNVVKFDKPMPGELSFYGDWALWDTGKGYTLTTRNRFRHDFRPLPQDPRRFVLAVVHGVANNKAFLDYDDYGRLRQFTDFAGRTIRVERDPSGHIKTLSIPDLVGNVLVAARYAYDPAGNLIEHVDADGRSTRYSYDTDHRIIALEYPSSLTYHYVYDSGGRCIESWGDYPDRRRDPALAPYLPTVMPDGKTPIKGLNHVKLIFMADGGREVMTTNEIQRFSPENGKMVKAVGNGGVTTRDFDAEGHEIGITDRNGGTRRFFYDDDGKIVREVDAIGREVAIERSRSLRHVDLIDAEGGRVSITRTHDGLVESITDQTGAATFYQLDERGLTREVHHPNGARSTFEVDAHGNMVRAQLPNGAVWQWRYDWWGRLVERTDPLGHVRKSSWSAAGFLQGLQQPDGSTLAFTYDAMGNLVEWVHPDGTTQRYEYGGNHWCCARIAPNGDTQRGYYDYEGNERGVVNERGELYRLELSPRGVTNVTDFAGVELRRRLDKMGWLTRIEHGDYRADYVYDAMGQIVEAEWADGTAEKYEYNGFGNVTALIGPDTEVRQTYDAAGHRTRETVVHRGDEVGVVTERATDHRVVAKKTSLGHEVRFTLDGMSDVVGIALPKDNQALKIARDLHGRILLVELPGGGRIENDWDASARLIRRRLYSPRAKQLGTGQPDWIAARGDGVVIEKSYVYSRRGTLAEVTSVGSGTTTYSYDDRERVVRRVPQHGAEEQFAWDPDSNLIEGGAFALAREYGRGNVLERRGGTSYHYDATGFLIEKTFARDDGATDRWQFEWTDQRLLGAIECPDGTRLEFAYDAFQRRIEKRVISAPRADDGERSLLRSTRFVYDDTNLIHERLTEYDQAGKEIGGEIRTYLYDGDVPMVPMGQRVVRFRGEERLEEPWSFYVNDVTGTPEEIVSGEGEILGRLERTAYGRTRVEGSATTPFRFPGQYEDPETGLHYNMMRYYDPDAGRYISPDPIGLAGGFNFYAYCTNPIDRVDPLGLDPHGLTWGLNDDVQPNNITSGSDPVNFGGKNYNGPGENDPKMDKHWGTPATASTPGKPNTGNSCTERKLLGVLDDPDNKESKKIKDAVKDGGTLNMKGQYPPCKKCHRAMKDWAAKNAGKGKIDYHYPTNQKVSYGSDNGKPDVKQGANNTAKSKALFDKYDKDGLTENKNFKKDKPVSNQNPKQKWESTQKYDEAKTEAQSGPQTTEWPKTASP